MISGVRPTQVVELQGGGRFTEELVENGLRNVVPVLLAADDHVEDAFVEVAHADEQDQVLLDLGQSHQLLHLRRRRVVVERNHRLQKVLLDLGELLVAQQKVDHVQGEFPDELGALADAVAHEVDLVLVLEVVHREQVGRQHEADLLLGGDLHEEVGDLGLVVPGEVQVHQVRPLVTSTFL